MVTKQNRKSVRAFLPLLILIVGTVVVLAGCRPATEKESRAPESANSVADKAVKHLGSEKDASIAVLAAWDKGYSLDQIVEGIEGDKLAANGKIRGLEPENRPQNYLKLSTRPLQLASTDLSAAPIEAPEPSKAAVEDVIEEHKAAWTAWIMGAIAKGYSVEQITMFMLEERRPFVLINPEFGALVGEKQIDPKTGKVVTYSNGQPRYVMVKPAFPPEGSPLPAAKIDGADQFVSDLAKDFEALVESKPVLRPSPDGKTRPPASQAGKGKFKPRAFTFKLSQMPGGSKSSIRSSNVTMRIDAKGRVTGSYNVETFQPGQYTNVTREEDGTFEGQAVYPKTKASMIRMDLDGKRHIKISSTDVSDGKTRVDESELSIRKMFQGVVSVDYSKGSGFLFAESGMFKWRLP